MSDNYENVIEMLENVNKRACNEMFKNGLAYGLTQGFDVTCAAIQNMEQVQASNNKEDFHSALHGLITIKKTSR